MPVKPRDPQDIDPLAEKAQVVPSPVHSTDGQAVPTETAAAAAVGYAAAKDTHTAPESGMSEAHVEASAVRGLGRRLLQTFGLGAEAERKK